MTKYAATAGNSNGLVASFTGRLSFGLLLFSFWMFMPGWLSADSVQQLTQASYGQYADWHPIGMALWWATTSKLFGPSFLLLQQLGLYWVSWAHISDGFKNALPKVYKFIPFIGLAPSFLLTFGHIWKDNQFASAAFFVTALLFSRKRNQQHLSRPEIFFSLALLSYAVSVKPNGAGVVVILLVLIVIEIVKDKTRKKLLKLMTIVALISLSALPMNNLVLAIVQPKREFSFQYVMVHDLQGISYYSQSDARPEYLKNDIEISEFRQTYIPDNANYLFFGRDAGSLKSTDEGEYAELTKTWEKQLVGNLPAYIQHRTAVFATLIRWGNSTPAFVANGWSDSNNFGFANLSSPAGQIFANSTFLLPWLFLPWINLLVSLIAFMYLVFSGRQVLYGALLFSLQLSFTLPHIVIAPASDYRYLLFSLLLTPILALLGFSELMRTKASKMT